MLAACATGYVAGGFSGGSDAPSGSDAQAGAAAADHVGIRRNRRVEVNPKLDHVIHLQTVEEVPPAPVAGEHDALRGDRRVASLPDRGYAAPIRKGSGAGLKPPPTCTCRRRSRRMWRKEPG